MCRRGGRGVFVCVIGGRMRGWVRRLCKAVLEVCKRVDMTVREGMTLSVPVVVDLQISTRSIYSTPNMRWNASQG